MTVIPPDSPLDEEAREWFVTLLFDYGEETILRWETWLAASPDRQAAYDRVGEIWAMSRHADRIAANDLRSPAHDHGTAGISRRVRSRPLEWLGLGLAASLVAAAFAGVWVYRSGGGAAAEASQRLVYVGAIETRRGQHVTRRLNDGSEVTAGGLTRMGIALTRTDRTVELRTGQVFVQVAKDRTRPFVVKASGASVTAVGTAFDVDLQESRIRVQVLHGTVLVRARFDVAGAATTYVHAGEGIFIEGGRFERAADTDETVGRPAWMHGRLEYRDIALRDVIADVNRYSAIPIVVADSDTGNLRYTGSVDVAEIQPWVVGVTHAFGLEMSQNSRLTVLRKKVAS